MLHAASLPVNARSVEKSTDATARLIVVPVRACINSDGSNCSVPEPTVSTPPQDGCGNVKVCGESTGSLDLPTAGRCAYRVEGPEPTLHRLATPPNGDGH